MVRSMGLAAAAAAVACGVTWTGVAAQTPLIADDPFVEFTSARWPYPGVWSESSIPTNWTNAACGAASQVVTVPLLTAGDPTPTPLVVCTAPTSTLWDPINNVVYALPTGVATADAVFTPCSGGTSGAGLGGLWMGNGTGIYAFTCDATTRQCVPAGVVASGTGAVTALYAAPLASGTVQAWASTSTGVKAWNVVGGGCHAPAPATIPVYASAPTAVAAAFAYSPVKGEMAYGNSTHLLRFGGGVTPALTRWEWVTNITAGWGTPIDDVITALVYGPDGYLYIANPTCLNVFFPNGTYTRIAGEEGLPTANLTSLALDTTSPPTQPGGYRLWIGTQAGAMLYDPFGLNRWGAWGGGGSSSAAWPTSPRGRAKPARPTRMRTRGGGGGSASTEAGDATSAPAAGPLHVPLAPQWRFFYGPRYLPCTPTDPFTQGSWVIPGGVASAGASAVLVTQAGVAVLTARTWTLAEKVLAFEAQLPVFDLYGQGLVGDCGLQSFGRMPCTPGPNDNNGLWTSLVVAAQSFRYAVTGDPDAQAQATHFLDGMHLLNAVTGIYGLIARSALPPGAPCPTNDPDWHNSTSMPGYCFKGTASSDEVVGHMMAYPLFNEYVGGRGAPDLASDLLLNLTHYIVVNNFTLVDVTGQPTQWGHWEPAALNGWQSWSDTRGLNSIQILGLINEALRFVPSGSPQQQLFNTALNYLALGNQYYINMINTRINAPSDINYSDDELTFFSYLALFNGCGGNTDLGQYAATSILRSWRTAVSKQRSDLWAGIYLTIAQTLSGRCGANVTSMFNLTPAEATAIASDIVWNLRTWSPDLIDWPVQNTQRLDVFLDPDADRFGQSNNQLLEVLPQWERCQGRWNANPFQVNGCGGTSMSDPGVWLMPYWLARLAGVVAGSAA